MSEINKSEIKKMILWHIIIFIAFIIAVITPIGFIIFIIMLANSMWKGIKQKYEEKIRGMD